MSEEKPTAESAGPPAPKPKGNPILSIGVVAGALIAGAAMGGLLVGPRLVAGRTGASHGKPAEAEGEGKHGEKGESGRPPVFRLDNIIVNPSGSQGAHFLMTSIAIEVPNSKMEEKLREHDAELRDLAITILEHHTLEELGLPGSRDRIKRSVLTAIQPLIGQSPKIRVFLPQFVIQ